jgi:hypothetical protein
LPAIDPGMLAGKFHRGLVVVKRVNCFVEVPAFGTVTCLTTYLEPGSMRRIGLLVHEYHEERNYQE